MTTAMIDKNGDLNIVFNKEKFQEDVLIAYKLNNGAEVNFYGDEIVSLILPNFEAQLGRGSLLGLDISLNDIKMQNNDILFNLDIQGQNINGKIDCSSLRNSKV